MQNFTEVRCLALDFKDQNYGCEIEMTGLTREQAARAVAALFGTTARRTREFVTYDPWEVLDNDGKKWRFVYDGSIVGRENEPGRKLCYRAGDGGTGRPEGGNTAGGWHGLYFGEGRECCPKTSYL